MNEINERRSIRKYQDREILRNTLEEIISAGIKAPSAKNRQPWRFVVLTAESKKKFTQLMKQGIEKERMEKNILPNSSRYISAAIHTVSIIEQAPVLIIVCNPEGNSLYKNLTPEEKIYERADIQSVGAAIQNILLKATSLGIGSLWICDIYFAYDSLSELLYSQGEILAAIALGYPAEHPTERPRKDFSDVTEFQ